MASREGYVLVMSSEKPAAPLRRRLLGLENPFPARSHNGPGAFGGGAIIPSRNLGRRAGRAHRAEHHEHTRCGAAVC